MSPRLRLLDSAVLELASPRGPEYSASRFSSVEIPSREISPEPLVLGTDQGNLRFHGSSLHLKWNAAFQLTPSLLQCACQVFSFAYQQLRNGHLSPIGYTRSPERPAPDALVHIFQTLSLVAVRGRLTGRSPDACGNLIRPVVNPAYAGQNRSRHFLDCGQSAAHRR